MRLSFLFIPALLSVLAAPAAAQDAGIACAKGRIHTGIRSAAKSTIADPGEDNYDVRYVRLNLSFTNTSTAISGDAVTRAEVVAASMGAYVFELDPQLSIDSCKVNGVLRNVATAGYVRTVALPAALPLGAAFTAQVFYHGQPASGSGFNSAGLITGYDPAWHVPVTYTLGEPYEAADWWPCKMSLPDKIDSADIWLTVADTLMAGSNGTLQAVTPLPGARLRYEWKHRSAINYYLLSASVARYADYSYYAHFAGSADSVLVQNYLYAAPGVLSAYKRNIDSVGLILDHFSTLFGRYPFWKEKYGHCIAPLQGGQEHQTMTTVGNLSTWVLAHELSHQWWGDETTCASFADIWLNEGFASYCEDLFYEHFHGKAAADADILAKHSSVMSSSGGSVYVSDTANEYRIFDGRLTYNKGASVMHMLRYLAGSDSVFFAMLRAYRQRYAGGVARTADLQSVAQTVYGRPLDSFFRQWVYGEGYPTYAATINQKGGLTAIRISQITSALSVPAFDFPVEVLCHSPAGDTTVTVPVNGASGLVVFRWSHPLQSVSIDPANWIPNREGATTQDASLGPDAGPPQSNLVAAPNPGRAEWRITGIPAGTREVALTDAAGRAVAHFAILTPTLVIPAQALPAGVYLLHIHAAAGAPETVVRLLRE